MNYLDTTDFVQLAHLFHPDSLGSWMTLWMIIFALAGWASVLYCIWQATTRMLRSNVRALRIKCWFVLVLTTGQGITSHAILTRALDGEWENVYLMAGLSLWLGGRIAITLYDKINKYRKDRRAK